MKNFLAIFLTATMALSLFAACGTKSESQQLQSSQTQTENLDSQSKIKVVTTIFPVYDWMREILQGASDDVELIMLLDSGVDLHSYQPTAEDMVTMATCDVFVYVGGSSESWVEGALANSVNSDMQVVNLMEVLGDRVKEEATVEGMESDHDHAHDDEDDHDHDDDEHAHEYDEHVWLSLKNASVIVDYLCDVLSNEIPTNAAIYKQNTQSYIETINALDSEYAKTVEEATFDTIVFGDRFPFRYLTDDYNIKYYAAFSGCSAETQASFETVAFLANKIDELGLNHIVEIEGTTHKIAQTVAQSTQSKNQEIVVLNSMQSTTMLDASNGATYLSIMQDNLGAIKTALS